MNSPDLLDPWIGRSIGDRQRYRLDKRLGEGGMGDVFLAMDTLLGQYVAVKLLKDTLAAEEDLRKRFEREVALCAALKSDHIVGVSDYGVTPEGHPFYVMEYLHGETLGQLLRREQWLSVERTVGIITQVCEALQLAHEGVNLWRNGAKVSEHVKVVHRDLKPDNIFLVPTALGELVKILDFGIAKIRSDRSQHTSLTKTNMFIGTFHYAAPEQLEVQPHLDERADIYSLGIILYEMLSGTDPFGLGYNRQEVSFNAWCIAHMSKPPVPLRSQPGLSQLSPKLEAVVMRCLQKAPSDRFASVDELKRALQAAFTVTSGASGTTNLQLQQLKVSQSCKNIWERIQEAATSVGRSVYSRTSGTQPLRSLFPINRNSLNWIFGIALFASLLAIVGPPLAILVNKQVFAWQIETALQQHLVNHTKNKDLEIKKTFQALEPKVQIDSKRIAISYNGSADKNWTEERVIKKLAILFFKSLMDEDPKLLTHDGTQLVVYPRSGSLQVTITVNQAWLDKWNSYNDRELTYEQLEESLKVGDL